MRIGKKLIERFEHRDQNSMPKCALCDQEADTWKASYDYHFEGEDMIYEWAICHRCSQAVRNNTEQLAIEHRVMYDLLRTMATAPHTYWGGMAKDALQEIGYPPGMEYWKAALARQGKNAAVRGV